MDTAKKLKNVAKFAETSAGCFAIQEDDLSEVEDDINELLKEKIIKSYHEEPEDAREDFEMFGTIWYALTNDGVEKIKKLKDTGKLSNKEYYSIIDALGW